MNERLLQAEAKCIRALQEGRAPSAADELPLLEEVRRITPMAEERLLIIARLREARAHRVADATPRPPAISEERPTIFPDHDSEVA